MKIERRFFGAEVRAGDSKKVSGHAAVFNQWADIGSYFRETISPGAFSETISKDDIRALWNHNSDNVLGRNKSGTLTLSEDETGLAVEIDPPASAVREVEAVQRGDVSQMSIGMIVLDESWERKDGKEHRTIKRAQLFDVSPVTFPAYAGTDVSVRSSADVLAELNSAAPIEPPADNLTAIRQRFEFMHRQQ